MRSHELARELLTQADREIMILDSFNGAGYPRTINLRVADLKQNLTFESCNMVNNYKFHVTMTRCNL